MKKYTIILSLVFLAASCVKDTGNYDYKPEDTVTPPGITGIDTEEGYVASIMGRLVIDPKVGDGANDAAYDYLWYAYGDKIENKDTLSTERKLDIPVRLPSGRFSLVFMVTDKKYGTMQMANTTLDVGSDFSVGWYVTKDDGETTDLDMITSEWEVVPGLLGAVNGEGPAGKAVKTVYMPKKYNYFFDDPDLPPLADQQAIFVMTDRDMRVYNGENLELFHDFKHLFMDNDIPNETLALSYSGTPPDDFFGYKGTMYAINDGKLYTIFGSSNMGKFPFFTSNWQDRLSPHLCVGSGMVMGFEETTRSFVWEYDFLFEVRTYTRFAENAVSPISCNNMDYDMVFMKENVNGGVALMKHITTGEYISMTFDKWQWNYDMLGLFGGVNNPIWHVYDVPATSRVATSAIRTVNKVNNAIYCSDGGSNVYMHTVSTGEEKTLISLPSGESVSFIAHISNEGGTFSHLVVLANSGGGWKAYFYDFVGYTAEIIPEPVKVVSGTGNARHIMWRDFDSIDSI